jgi:uncharacterized protein
MRSRVITSIGIILLLVGAWGLWRLGGETEQRENLPSLQQGLSAEEKGDEVRTEGGPVIRTEVSLPALSSRQLEGREFSVGKVLADNEAYTRYYVTYLSGELMISGVMNVPKGEGAFPLLVLNHGYIDPAVYTNGRGLRREQDYLARQGYVVLHLDYRNHAESDKDSEAETQLRLGYAEDVINATKAIRAAGLPYVDAGRVGMMGHSMGGGIAWRIAVTQPKLIDVFVQLAPVSADERDNFEKWIRRRPQLAEDIINMYGEPENNAEFWDNISPITFFQKVEAPIMVHHGTADESVPFEWSERAAAALTAQGKEVTLYTYPGEPHEFVAAWPQVMRRSADFFDRYLKD